jgi:hypothetical protein
MGAGEVTRLRVFHVRNQSLDDARRKDRDAPRCAPSWTPCLSNMTLRHLSSPMIRHARRRAAHLVYQCCRVVWQPIASPGHVLIGAREEQFARVERSGLIRVDVDHSQRHATVAGGGNEVADIEL